MSAVEVWRPVEGHEGIAEVSNFGRVKSLARMCRAGARGLQMKRERIVKGARHRYQFVYLALPDGGNKHHYVHRLVAKAFVPNPEGKPQVNHIDGDRFNNRPANLEWVTAKENARHAYDTGLHVCPKGEDWYTAKLTNEQVREIRAAYRPFENTLDLATKYGVTRETINGIGNGRKRRDLACLPGCACLVCRGLSALLTADQVRYIRSSPKSLDDLASELGVDRATIRRVRNRQTWTRVPCEMHCSCRACRKEAA